MGLRSRWRQWQFWQGRQGEWWTINDKVWPALAVVIWFYRRLVLWRVTVIVVIGSLGKTTTMRLVSAAVGQFVHPLAACNGNTRALVGLAMLRIRPWQRHAVVEVGLGKKGEMVHYARVLRPDVVIATAVASDHNTSFETLTGIRDEKGIMPRMLRARDLLLVNGDDPNTRWMATQTRARVVLYGMDAENAVRGGEVKLDWPRGMRLRVQAGGEPLDVHTRMVGGPMVYPVLAAVAAARELGVLLVGPGGALARIAEVVPEYGRLQPVELANGAVILRDEGKSGVETVETALDVLAAVPAERRIVVMGDLTEPMGTPREIRFIYRRIGERIGRVANRAIFMRGHASDFSHATRRSGMARQNITVAEDVYGAVEQLRGELGPGVVVLLKGRFGQRLERIALLLMGREVRCQIKYCQLKIMPCDVCPKLARADGGMEQDLLPMPLRRILRLPTWRGRG